MKTARQILYEDICLHRAVTARELSERLRMTEANARHHLKILQEQGLIEVVGELPAAGKRRGRPRRLYGPSRQQHRSLVGLLHAFWQELSLRLTPEETERFLQAVAQRLAGPDWRPAATSAGNLTPHLVAVTHKLNELHYQARWEARRDGPWIIMSNCPYADLPQQYAEFCRLDFYLLQTLTRMEPAQISRLKPDYRGLPHCVFQLTAAIHQQTLKWRLQAAP